MTGAPCVRIVMPRTHTRSHRQRAVAERLVDLVGEPGAGLRLRQGLVTSDADRLAVVALIEEMVAADPLLAQTAPSVSALLRSAVASEAVTAAFAQATTTDDPDDAWVPDDVLRIARVRGQAEAAILHELMFDAPRTARAMGSRSSNVREYARQLRAKPGVLALPVGNRFVFPSFQFDEPRRRLWPIAVELNELLGAADDPWGAAGFWYGTDTRLGARPADLVWDDTRAADLRAAAARELAPAG